MPHMLNGPHPQGCRFPVASAAGSAKLVQLADSNAAKYAVVGRINKVAQQGIRPVRAIEQTIASATRQGANVTVVTLPADQSDSPQTSFAAKAAKECRNGAMVSTSLSSGTTMVSGPDKNSGAPTAFVLLADNPQPPNRVAMLGEDSVNR
jgi:hypothetical protein